MRYPISVSQSHDAASLDVSRTDLRAVRERADIMNVNHI